MPFGMMAPPPLPPPQEEEESPLSFAQGMGIVPPPNPTFSPEFAGGNIPSSSPDWAQQLLGSSSSPPTSSKPLEGGSALISSSKSQGKGSRWLDMLAPILAGAGAVLGFKKDSPFGDVLMGVGKGFAEHLTTEAKAKRDLKSKSENSTVDLAHKYLASMPGEVDEEKYPRLAEMGRNLREKLTNGQLSSPKEAQDFILEFTKYKEDLQDLTDARKHQEELAHQNLPYESFQQAFEGARGTDLLAPLMAKHGGLYEDPNNPGHFIPAAELTSRGALTRREMQDKASLERAKLGAEAREKTAAGNRAAALTRTNITEGGRTRRHRERLGAKGGASSKEYDAVYKAASAHARALDSKRPTSDPEQVQLDTYDYLLNAGHVVPIRGKNRQVGYYIGNGQVTTDRAKAERLANAGRTMTPPPSLPSAFNEEEEEEEDFD